MFCRSQQSVAIVLGVILSLSVQCLLVFQEKPTTDANEESTYDIDTVDVSSHTYNIVDLINVPQSSGYILKYKSWIVTKSIFSSLIIRKILNKNGILEVRKLASTDKISKLPPIHYPIHKASGKQMKIATDWNQRYYNEILHNGIMDDHDDDNETTKSKSKTKSKTKQYYYSIMDYHNVYKSGKATPTQVMGNLLEGIEQLSHLHIFASMDADLIRQQALESTQRWLANQPLSIWDGVPVAIKDMSPIASLHLCDGSSQCHLEKEDDYPAKQLRNAGAIIVGTTVMTGMFISCWTSSYRY